MRVIVCSPHAGILSFLQFAAELAGFQPDGTDSVQELTSALYRDPASIGVITPEPLVASHVVLEMRRAEVRNPIFVLINEPSNAVFSKVAVRVLGHGADDVQPLPIDEREYAARLAALARRDRGAFTDFVELPNGGRYWQERGVIECPGGQVSLTRLEANLLNAIVSHPGKVVSKEAAMEHLYAGRDEPDIKIIDVFICKLRKKLLAATGGVNLIRTVWGHGYVFESAGVPPEFPTARKTA